MKQSPFPLLLACLALLPSLAHADSLCSALTAAKKAGLEGSPDCSLAKKLQQEYKADFASFVADCEALEKITSSPAEDSKRKQLSARLQEHLDPPSLEATMNSTLSPSCAKDIEPLYKYRAQAQGVLKRLRQKVY